MNQKNKICITFSWPVGCSKTPISNYLSTKLNLPIFNNDAIRSEVIEDLWMLDNQEHIRRRDLRLNEIIKSGISFICDLSIDRHWNLFKKQLTDNNYKFYIISIDLSKELLIKLYNRKGYTESLISIDKFIEDHKMFLEKYSHEINLHIQDENFKNRCELSYNQLNDWLIYIK